VETEPVERRLAAILAADVVGYSRLMGLDQTGTRARFNAILKETIEPAIERRRGRVVKLLGDGLLVEFASVVDALHAAVAIQNGMAQLNAGEEANTRMVFRIGINVGDVIVEGDDIHGDGVNVAARLEALAEPGGICISQTVREQLQGEPGFALEDMGAVRVKNISRPVHFFRVHLGDERPRGRIRARVFGRRGLRLAMALALLGGLALAGWFVFGRGAEPVAGELPDISSPRLSIAVLPFETPGGGPENDYLADALTEDLTSDLSRIAGSFVISRGTAATYAGREIDAREIARDLNVRYLLEGSVRRSDDMYRVSVQLTDGETAQQLWAERYERAAGDMYAFQSEVTGRVARSLNLQLKEAESRQAARTRAGNPDAEDLALRAWAEIWTRPQSPETNARALELVARALTLDPENAEASGVAAYAYARAATYGWGMSRAEAIEAGKAPARRSLALDPRNADAVYALGFLSYLAGDTDQSLELMQQCIERNRNHAPAYFFYGVNLIRKGQPEEAIRWVERAFTLSPRDPLRSVWYGVIGRAQVLIEQDEAAIGTAEKGIAANARHPHNHAVLASALAHLGRTEDARAALADFLERQPGVTLTRYWTNIASSDPDALQAYARYIDGLRLAGLTD
jgi:class 3 adenylate cyclase/TolB-like protein/Tfp pilus assembly protein PilF